MPNKQIEKGFTLIELMIVIAIIGILAAVAVPQYGQYTKRAKFADVVTQASNYKIPVTECIQDLNDTAGCSNNSTFIGPILTTGEYLTSVTVVDGTITATGNNLVDNAVYRLIPSYQQLESSVDWAVDNTVTDSCTASGLC